MLSSWAYRRVMLSILYIYRIYTNRFLPLIFFYRTLNSKKKLGAEFSKEERSYVRSKEMVTLENVSRLMRSMPQELLFVIRASNMVGIHNAVLGGNTRTRLKSFTGVALRCVYTNPIVYAYRASMLYFKLFLFENMFWLYRIIVNRNYVV